MKRIIAMIVCLMMVFSTCALAERGGMGGPGGGMGGPGGGMGGGMTQNDEEIQAILDANAPNSSSSLSLMRRRATASSTACSFRRIMTHPNRTL